MSSLLDELSSYVASKPPLMGVTVVVSMVILEPEQVLKHVMEGAGTTLFKRFCREIAFTRKG